MFTRLTNTTQPIRTALAPRAPRPPRRLPARLAAAALAAGLLLPVPLMGLSGCQDHRHDGESWLSVGTVELRRDIRVGDPIRNRDESNLLFVAVPVRNATDKQLYVQGVMTFYDHYGNELNRVSRTLTLPADQSDRFQGNSTSPQAESFRLALNYPRVE